jgi:hypothetical protein
MRMLGDRSRLLRLLLLAMTVFAAVSWPTKHYAAYAATGGDDDDDSGGGGGDDDDSAKSGGGDDDGGGSADDDDADADADQPPVTAGGLYTKTTYPISTIERPLTLIEGMTEVQVGIGTDISAANAFKNWNALLNAHYGIKDNSEIQFGLASDLNNFHSFSAYVGYEGALSYDVVDFRAAFILPITKTSVTSGTPPMTSSSTNVAPGVQVGFPVKYRLKPEVAIIALRNLMTINFKSKPDLTPTVGAIIQPVPAFAAIVQAGITIIGFNTDAGNFQIPVSVAAQFTPSNAIDLGLQFAFPNLKPAKVTDPMGNDITPKFYDSRTLLFYGTFRF